MIRRTLLAAGLALATGLTQAQNVTINQNAAVLGNFTAQNWLSNSPLALYTVPAGVTARITDVTVWGGEIAAGRTCSIVLYCSASSGTDLTYFMADAGKSTLYNFNSGLTCKAGAKFFAYYYAPTTYSAESQRCANGGQGQNTPWLILRGVLYR
ncbi:hypothetical protein [Derxia gummosa]|uniref:Uncharacterized protein n=1 Tax=Derxia gummosa DSM 723 TaxID=1121388 RepID=A0A8B6X628_9BURK|nr:hypothetical protein [Derxia gummosa]